MAQRPRKSIDQNYTSRELVNMTANELAELHAAYFVGIYNAFENDNWELANKYAVKAETIEDGLEDLYDAGKISDSKWQAYRKKYKSLVSRFDGQEMEEIFRWIREYNTGMN